MAFSDTVDDEGDEYTEVVMNKVVAPHITETNLPKSFNKNEFKILIVTEKYQIGFTQPKLCAMYVDKKLDGVKMLQTLSRLNQTYPDKQPSYWISKTR